MATRKRPVSDVEYTGLSDSAIGYSGSTTLDSSVDLGSPLPLVIASDRNAPGSTAQQLTSGTAQLWDSPSAPNSLALSGVSDPPFASAGMSTPFPNAQEPDTSTSNAFNGQSKFGSGIATLLGNHPQMVTSIPSEVHGIQARTLAQPSTVSGTSVSLAVIVAVVLITLLLLEGGDD